VGPEPVASRLEGDEAVVLVAPTATSRRELLDAQVAPYGQVDDGRGDVPHVGPLVDERPEQAGGHVVGWLELHRADLALEQRPPLRDRALVREGDVDRAP